MFDFISYVWITSGFTYDEKETKYCLIKHVMIMNYVWRVQHVLVPRIITFFFERKAQRSLDWATGNKSLDLIE